MSVESKKETELCPDSPRHKKRASLFEKLIPQDSSEHAKRKDLLDQIFKNPKLKYILSGLAKKYEISEEDIKDVKQEIWLELHREIVERGNDQNTESWYLEFAKNRAIDYLNKNLFRVRKYEERVWHSSSEGNIWGKKIDHNLQRALEKHSSDTYVEGASSDAWEVKWSFIQNHPKFSDVEKTIIEQLLKVRTEDRDNETIRKKLKLDKRVFDVALRNIKKKSRALLFDIIWWPSKLQMLTVEKFERVLEKIIGGEHIYIPYRRERWTKKEQFYSQKVASAI